MNEFNTWLDTFISEKEIDTEKVLEVVGNSGINYIPVGVLIEHIKIAPKNEQERIKEIIVLLDFKNASIIDFFKHLAGAVAI